MFNELSRLEIWKGENPITKVRAFEIPECELSFLSIEQIRESLDELNRAKNEHVCLFQKYAW